jgi:hypothetical protein
MEIIIPGNSEHKIRLVASNCQVRRRIKKRRGGQEEYECVEAPLHGSKRNSRSA